MRQPHVHACNSYAREVHYLDEKEAVHVQARGKSHMSDIERQADPSDTLSHLFIWDQLKNIFDDSHPDSFLWTDNFNEPL